MLEWDENRAKKIASSKLKMQNVYAKPVRLPDMFDDALIGVDTETGAFVYNRDLLSRLIGAYLDVSEVGAEANISAMLEHYKNYFKKPILVSPTGGM
jgi:hypothetical protein